MCATPAAAGKALARALRARVVWIIALRQFGLDLGGHLQEHVGDFKGKAKAGAKKAGGAVVLRR